jgi:hypothetical protein
VLLSFITFSNALDGAYHIPAGCGKSTAKAGIAAWETEKKKRKTGKNGPALGFTA